MEKLEKYFDMALSAPGGIIKIRQLILRFVIQGRLVDNYTNNRKELTQIIPKSKSIKEPFNLPKNWKWVHLSDIAEIIRGVSYQKTNAVNTSFKNSIELLRANNIQSKIIFDNTIFIPLVNVKDHQILRPGDLVIAMSSGSPHLVGKAALFESGKQYTFGAFCGVIRPLYPQLIPYLEKFCQSPIYRDQTQIIGKGIGIQNLNKEELENLLVPVPPFEEINNICYEIESLSFRCDELEKLQFERDQKRQAMHTAVIRKMLDAPDQKTFDGAWQFITRHFGELYTVRENVDELSKAIILMAVMGKLVKQNPKEGTGRELLKEIEKDKNISTKNGRSKEPNNPPLLNSEVLPYRLPKGWTWCKLEDLTIDVSYGTSEKAIKENIGVPVLRMGNINLDGKISFNDLKYVNSKISDLPKLYLNDNDLVFNRTNSLELVGKSAVFIQQDIPYTLASYLIRVRFFNCINSFFVSFFINSTICRQTQIFPNVVQQNGQANFNGSKLKSIVIPIPPKAEQDRIVHRVNQFIALCDTLDSHIDTLQEKQEELLGAVMSDVF